jgi:hypothetical protein
MDNGNAVTILLLVVPQHDDHGYILFSERIVYDPWVDKQQ